MRKIILHFKSLEDNQENAVVLSGFGYRHSLKMALALLLGMVNFQFTATGKTEYSGGIYETNKEKRKS